MESAEKIVENYCRHIKHWFTVSNVICAGQYEIDIMAVEFPKVGPPRAYQIESGVSLAGGFSKLTAESHSEEDRNVRVKAPSQRRTIGYFIERKFGPKAIKERIADFGLNPEEILKVIVAWGWEEQVKEIADVHNITLWNFPALLNELAEACAEGKTYFTDDTFNTLQLFMKSGYVPLRKNK